MDLQYFGANCLRITTKQATLVIDDNLKQLGLKSITKPEDIVLFTAPPKEVPTAKLVINDPGEYEVSGISIRGIAMRSHLDAEGLNATIYHLDYEDIHLVIIGHIHASISEDQIEAIGHSDVLIVPVGGHGYTLDAEGALKIIKDIEPRVVIPTHYADPAVKYEVPQAELAEAIKVLSMEAADPVARYKVKPADYSEATKLVILQRS